MKKIKILPLILAASLSLAACNTGKNSEGEKNFNSSPNVYSTTVPQPIDPRGYYLPFTLFGADNIQIKISEVTSVTGKNGEDIAPALVGDTDWSEIVCDGFAHLAVSGSTALNSIDNADRYNAEQGCFTDVPAFSEIEYCRIYVGKKFGDLTLTSAKTTFSRVGYEDKSGPLTTEQIKAEGMAFSGMLKRCNASFDGSVTMTGYIRVNVDEYGVEDGDVIFAPSADCPLPIMNFHPDRDPDRVNTPLWTQQSHGFAYVSEYPTIRLGNIHLGADIGDIPTNGTSVKVQITVTDITMFSDTHMSSFIDCKLVNIDRV